MNKTLALEKILLEAIRNGCYRPGEAIPSRNRLMQKYQLSRCTVERAVGNLIRNGILAARRGAGTVVTGEFAAVDSGLKRIIFIQSSRMQRVSTGSLEKFFEVRYCPDDELPFCLEKFTRPDTLFLWFYPGCHNIALMQLLKARGVRQLQINRNFCSLPYIAIDYEPGLRNGLQKLAARCGNSGCLISFEANYNDEPYHAERLLAYYRAAAALELRTPVEHVFTGGDEGMVDEAVKTLFLPNAPKRMITILSRRLAGPFLLAAAAAGKMPGRDFELLLVDYLRGLELQPGITMLNQQGYQVIGEYMLQIAAEALKTGDFDIRRKILLEPV